MGSRSRYNVVRNELGNKRIITPNLDFDQAVILTEMLQQRHELDYRIKVALKEITEDEMHKQVLLVEFNYEKI